MSCPLFRVRFLRRRSFSLPRGRRGPETAEHCGAELSDGRQLALQELSVEGFRGLPLGSNFWLLAAGDLFLYAAAAAAAARRSWEKLDLGFSRRASMSGSSAS